MSTPPILCPGARVRGWYDGVESMHGGACGDQCVWCLVKLVGGKISDALDCMGDDVTGAWGRGRVVRLRVTCTGARVRVSVRGGCKAVRRVRV